jgi:putative ABC transport system permease protein
MSPFRLILASLVYHWRTNLAVACGVAAGTAVLSGALLVGDSMRGSLHDLTLKRLGRIDELLLTDHFFRRQLADELARQPAFQDRFGAVVPAIILRASLENTDQQDKRRANRVNLLGCDSQFWQLGPGRPPQLSRNQIVLNQPLADRLGVGQPGEDVILHLPDLGTIPGDSPLGKKTDTVKRPRLTVAAILPAEGLGRFSLRPNQQVPLNAYVSMTGLQGRLGQSERVNAVLVAGKGGGSGGLPESRQTLEQNHNLLEQLLRPAPADYGIRIEEDRPDLPAPQKPDFRYINITSDRMLLEPAIEAAIRQTLERDGATFQAVLTYLANAIARTRHEAGMEQQDDDGKVIPYSTITAVDFAPTPPLGPFLTPDGKPIEALQDREGRLIVLNSEAAEDLGVTPRQRIYVRYFRPEGTHGQALEETHEFTLAAIADLAGAADDRAFTPVVRGLTDKRSIYGWEVPFSPYHRGLLRSKDEKYFKQYGLTPKAFVSLAAGQRLWGSRFGQTTGFRVKPDAKTTVESLTERLQRELQPDRLGFVFQPVKLQGLRASAGTTPFNVLFLSFSFFIIAAAVTLVALLFRLGIDQRARQLGILAAVGFSRRRIALLLAGEGLVVSALGGLVGVPAGVGYAALMILGLRTWWVKAVVTPFLHVYLRSPGRHLPWSLVIGYASGVLVALLAIVWTMWRSRRVAVVQLLAGQTTEATAGMAGRPRYAGKVAWAMLLFAVVLGLLAVPLGEEMQAGAFFGAGALVLMATLSLVWIRLRRGATGAAVTAGRTQENLSRIALRNAARNPGRSTLTIALVAAACFLIVAVSAFRLDPSRQAPRLASGNGGFALVAESDQPIYPDLSTPAGRDQLGFSAEDEKLFADATTIGLRVKSGDDASCLNLYRPRQPRVLGVPTQMIDRGGFVFAASAAVSPQQRENPWLLLEQDLGTDTDGVPLVPVILEKNTATYSLHLTSGVGQTYAITDDSGQTVRLKIVGLLGASIFQGDLLISEGAFVRYFPDVSGRRFFLIELPNSTSERTEAAGRALERDLGEYGLVAEGSGQRLARFLVVQNTYLSTFQNLGGLGLLLGTFGLAAVQLRNVLERRGELALLRAAGFRRRTLAELVMLENGLLLCAGLGCGALAALIAVLPHLLLGRAAIPWASLAGTLALVVAVGLLAGLAAVRVTLTAPLLATLREER